MQEYISNSLEDTKKIAEDLASRLDKSLQDKATIIGLYGELGAGKTTFMKYFAEALGVSETIQSPTFVIMRKHELRNTSYEAQKNFDSNLVTRVSCFDYLIHIDAYRLDSGEDLKKIGWDELVADPRNLICIEWPERVAEILPDHIVVRFEHLDEWSRKVLISYEKK